MSDRIHPHALQDGSVFVDDEMRCHVRAIVQPIAQDVFCCGIALCVVQDDVLLILGRLAAVAERAMEVFLEFELGSKPLKGLLALLSCSFLSSRGVFCRGISYRCAGILRSSFLFGGSLTPSSNALPPDWSPAHRGLHNSTSRAPALPHTAQPPPYTSYGETRAQDPPLPSRPTS